MIFEGFTLCFEKVIGGMEKHGMKKVISTLFIIIFFMIFDCFLNMVQLPSVIHHYLETEVEQHNQENSQRETIDPMVRQQLLKEIIDLNCDRAFLFEMHNGVSNPSGLPFRYCEMTYEELGNKATYDVSDEYDRVNMSKYPIFTYLKENTIFIGTISDLIKIDNKMGLRMKHNDVKYLALKLISGTDSPLGVVGVSYCNDSVFSTQQNSQIMADLANYGDKISTLIDAK